MIFQYAAPLAILTGAALTSLNKGARITGYGFGFLALGAAIFAGLAYKAGDAFGATVNAMLLVVNGFGIHRWLRHNAVVEDIAEMTETYSARSFHDATVITASALMGQHIYDGDNDIGEVTDAVVHLKGSKVSYLVVHLTSKGAGNGFVGVPFACVSKSDEYGYHCLQGDCRMLPEGVWPSDLEELA